MKKKIAITLIIVLALFAVFSIVHEKITYTQMSFEDKILNAMNFDNFENKIYIDDIVFLEEAEDGHFCVATSSSEETVHFGYIREKDVELEFAGKSFSSIPMIVYNDDPTMFLRTSILNFSEKDFYYGCYQHQENLQVKVNDSEVEIHNFSLSYNGETYNMDFWLVCSENEPVVEIVSDS